MKKMSAAFICTVLLSASIAASAAPGTELKVNGTVAPAACSLQLGNNGYVVYGLIASSSVNKATNTTLPTKTANFVITCDLPMRLSLAFSDNRASSKVEGLYQHAGATHGGWYGDRAMYGLGTVGGKNIGAFQLGFANVRQDGQFTYGLQSRWGGYTSSEEHWGNNYTNLIATSLQYTWGIDGPASVKTITGELTVTPVLEKGQNLPTGEEINFDGSVTVELRYL